MTTEIEILDARKCTLGEGPAYDAERQRLWWVDILRGQILWRNLVSAEHGHFDVGDNVGAVILRDDGNLTACLTDSLVVIDADSGQHLSSVSMPELHSRARVPLRLNDAKCAPDGTLFAGSMFLQETPESAGASALYWVSHESINPVLKNVTLSNGLGWSPDGTIMYYVDTRTQRIDQFDFSGTTGPVNRRPLAQIDAADGNPDGLCVDADGGIWLALWGGSKVIRLEASGKLSESISIPTPQPTSLCFYGEHLSELCITTAAVGQSDDDVYAGLTLSFNPGVTGCPVARFHG